MEAVKETLTYQADTGLNRNLLPGDYKNKSERNPETKHAESNYVDLDALLDMKSEGTKTVKVTFTGEGNQLAVFKCNSDTSGDKSPGGREADDNVDQIYPKDFHEERSKGTRTDRPAADCPLETSSSTRVPNINVDFENGNITELQPEIEPRDYNNGSEIEELEYTDMYLNSKSDSDDGASVVMSEHCEPETVEDESHYITTHEIQLTELDHDVDYDFGRGTCWDLEDDNLVYSFVDYASLESDEKTEGTLIVEGRSQAKVTSGKAQPINAHQRAGAAVASTEQESDPCDSDKCASSDESVCKNPDGVGNPTGQIHLSIKTSSRAINESNNIPENDNICYHTKHVGDRSRFFFTRTDARAEALRDTTQYFIPAPGRQHLATKLRGKDINEYSSGASSSISELDDADKEVRNLTAKSFRSLACPYFDAINLSTSSESSVSEYGLGLNKWSAYVDFKNRNGKATCNNKKMPQTRMYALNKKMTSAQQASSSTKNIQLRGQPGQGEVITLTETLNFRCNVAAGLPERGRRPKSSENARGLRSKDEVTGTAPAKQGCEVSNQHSDAGDGMEDPHKKSSFASSLLKNVISKKMQFEHERKMERGEIRDSYPPHPASQCKDQDGMRERGLGRALHRQSSETSSGFSANSPEDPATEESRPSSCDTAEERCGHAQTDALDGAQPTTQTVIDEKRDAGDPSRGPLSRSQNSAFKSWKDGEQEHPKEPEMDRAVGGASPTKDNTRENKSDTVSSKQTKLSHLFVPSSQLLPKDKESREQLSDSAAVSGAPVDPREGGEGQLGVDNVTRTGGDAFGAKVPEIKICLRSVKDNKGYPLNIANLLTPKIGYNAATSTKTAGDSKLQVFTASDKVPHFTVRDIRDNKCKFHPPIYQVRDVRKLVKSSYRVVSLDHSENRPQANPPVAAEIRVSDEGSKKELDKTSSPAPIVIKCQSVNISNMERAADAPLRRQNEADPSTPKVSIEHAKPETTPPQRTTSRLVPIFAKLSNPDQSELYAAGERKLHLKIPKQAALEKLKAAVKTMEQLYVFDRNEWKRKIQAPRPITDSHVLSLITREEQGGPSKTGPEEELGGASGCERLTHSGTTADRFSHASTTETRDAQEDKSSLKIIHVPFSEDTFKTQSQQSKTFSNKSVFHLGGSTQTPVSASAAHSDALQSCSLSQTPSVVKSVTAKAPLSFKITPPRRPPLDRARLKGSPTNINSQQQPAKPGNPDSENYLTIPVEGYVGEIKFPNQELSMPGVVSKPCGGNVATVAQSDVGPARSPDPPPATIYHHAPRPQVFCFSPAVPTLSPAPSGTEPYQQTQRKMLLDPATGQCYLVDTPVLPATKRLFDPETGQFVDVPVPARQAVCPVAPGVTPVPVSISPLAALASPGTLAPAFVIYPGFVPTSPPFPAGAAEDAGGAGAILPGKYPAPPGGGQEANPPYYSATGGSAGAAAVAAAPVSFGRMVGARGTAAASDGQPVISITGPRIIAPPCFDGTTMSFVVEHQ